ncbi:MAG TPA: NIPSNAP family protein [Verrucomicrobiales bacterium]|nr:NIPSNAP family protein [Verrucomicrobiales bacterium]
MKLSILLATLFISLVTSLYAAEGSDRIFELRTYYANEGKLDALHTRFRDHTCELFEKHGMQNVGYWVPVKNESNALIYIVSHASRKAAQESWSAFLKDPAWVAAYKASIAGGKLVRKIDRVFLTATDYSPTLKIESQNPHRLFELRTYTTHDGKRANINKRFRDHTCALFTKHGISNLLYCDLMEDQQSANVTLTYLIAHKDENARAASWEAFRKDPAWQAARKASQVDGPILLKKGGVKSILLAPVDYSAMK